MKHTMRFSVGGQTVDVPNDELEQFRTAAAEHGATPDEVKSYRVDGKDVEVPDSQYEQFSAMAKERGATPQPLRRLSFADGSTRDFTMPELSKFLRSKEWREDERYAADREDARQRNEAAHKGLADHPTFLGSLVTGYMDAKDAAEKGALRGVGKELGAFAGIGTGNLRLAGAALGGRGALGGWAMDAANWIDDKFDWFADDLGVGKSGGGGVADTMSNVGEQGSSMAAGLLPWMVPSLMGANVAAAGGNSFAQTYDDAIRAGASDESAYMGAVANGALNMIGAYAMGKMPIQRFLKGFGIGKGGAAASVGETVAGAAKGAAKEGGASFKSLVDGVAKGRMRQEIVQHAKGAAEMGGISAVQDFISTLLNQETQGKELDFEDALLKGLKSGGHGVLTGLAMAGIHGAEHVIRRKTYHEAARRDVVDWQANASPEDLRTINKAKFDELAAKRKEGKDISRSDAEAAGLSPELGKDWRNGVFDEFNENNNRARPDELQSQALDEAIAEIGGEGETAKVIREEVLKNIDDAKELDDPKRRAELVADATNGLMRRDATPTVEQSQQKIKSAKGSEEKARRKTEMEEYERQEAERKAREEAEQNAPRIEVGTERPPEPPKESPNPDQARLDAWPEYAAWIKKNGRKNNAKNWNRFVAEHDLDPNMKVETRDKANKREADEFERGLAPDEELAAFGEYNEAYRGGKTELTFDEWLKAKAEGKPTETPAEAPRSAPKEEGTTTPPKPTEDAEGGKSAENGVVEPSAPVEPPKTPQTPPEKPVSAKKMRTMKHEKVIALPDSWQKYSELQSRLMRTGDKGGISVESPAGKQIKAEMERMDADGWGDLYRAKMEWAGADKKTRGEQPPDTLEAFKEWQAAKTGGKPAETTPETPVAEPTESAGAKTAEQKAKETRREAFRNDPVLQRIDAEYKKAKTDAERNALKEQFVARVAELRKQGKKVPKGAEPTAAEGKAKEAEPPKEEVPKADEIEKMTDEELKKRIEDVFNNSEDMEPDEFKRAIKPYRDEQNRRKEASKTDADRQKESLDRAFGDFTDENGKPKTITQLIDNGWRFEKKKVGAAHRYRLVKDGVDAYHDLSSKKVRSLMRPGNYDLNIKAIEEYSNSVHKPDAAETAKPAEAEKTGDTAKPAPKRAKPVKADAEAEAPKPKSKGRKTKAAKADAKKAAKVVENFVSKDGTRKGLQHVHHDHKGGVAVATDGRVLIATKHGYDKNAKGDPENPFPNWRQVIPNYDGATYEHIERDFDVKSGKHVLKKTKHPVQKVEVDPAAISETCRKVAALANKIGNKDTIHAALKLPDGKVVVMDAAYLRKVADAMAANGITEIKAVDGKRPILAKNADTTIVAMPLRADGSNPTEADFRKGRGGSGIVIDALTGRILSAPERSDNTAMTSRKWADELRKHIESDKTIDADKARKIKREIENIEKRIAAEDEIDALMGGDKAAEPTGKEPGRVEARTPEEEIDPSGTPTKKNPLGQIVAPEDGSVAQSIDAEIAADEALTAKGKGKAQGAPPAPAPGSPGNATLNPHHEPESLGAGVKDPVARQEIVDRFKELFGDIVAIKGKNTTPIGKNFAGHYEPDAGVVRTKNPVSLDTIPHEVGHHIDAMTKRLGLARPPVVRHELIALGQKLYNNPKQKPAGGYEAEGFAELMKYYMQGNDAGLKKEVPEAYKWLTEKFGKADPDTMAKVDDIRDMIDRLQNQSGEQAVRSIRAKDPTLGEQVMNTIANIARGLKPTQENWLDTGAFITKGMRASELDKLFDWRGALKRGDAAAMSDIIENHPVLKWKLYNGKAGARAYIALEKGLTDLSGTRRYTYGDLGVQTPGHAANETLPTFKEIFGDFTRKEMDAFEDYAIARIAKEAYLDKGLEFGLTAKEVEPVLRKYANNTKFREALDRYTHYKHGVLHLLVDAGAMSQEQFEAIVAANPIYVKIARRRESTDAFRDRMMKRRGKAVNRRKGGGQQIEDIFDAGLVDDERVFKAAFQADLLRSLVNAGKRGESAGGVEAGYTIGANWLREVPNAQGEVKFTAEKLRKQITDAMVSQGVATDKAAAKTIFDQLFNGGDDTLSIFKEKPSDGKNGVVSLYDESGKLHTYELPENNAEGWAKGLMGFTDATKPNILEQWVQIAAAATRSGATTLNPVFALRNIVKDTLHASTVNEFGAYIPGVSTVQGIAMDLMNTSAKQIFENMGIPMGSMLGESRLTSARRANNYLMSKNWFERQWNKGIKKAIADFVGFSENGSRIKEFKNVRDFMLKNGASEKAADMLAGANALDITIDFQRGGEITKAINRFIPFFNAGVQGLEQAARSLGILRAKEWQRNDSRGKRAARTVLQGAGTLTMLALAAEFYNRSDDDRKKRVDALKPHEKWNYISFDDIRIPVPYEIGYAFASIPKAVAAELYDGQEGAVAECLNMLRKTLPGLNPRDMALIGPALNVAMNELWTGSDIVPEHVMRGKRSYDWYDERTSEFSKHLAKAFHKVFGDSKLASPAHLDAFLNGVTGNMYGRTIGAIGGESKSEIDPARPYTWPGVGTFFRNNATASRTMSDFYERRNELTRMKGSGEASVGEIKELKSANEVAETLTKFRKYAERVRADKTLTVTGRNDRLDEITKKMQELVRKFDAYWKERRKK